MNKFIDFSEFLFVKYFVKIMQERKDKQLFQEIVVRFLNFLLFYLYQFFFFLLIPQKCFAISISYFLFFRYQNKKQF